MKPRLSLQQESPERGEKVGRTNDIGGLVGDHYVLNVLKISDISQKLTEAKSPLSLDSLTVS